MAELLAVLFPVLLVDVLNPVLFALLVFAAGSSRPVANSSSLLVGHTIAYFAVGVAVAHGLDVVTERLANPKRIDFVIEGIVGSLLLWSVLKVRDEKTREPDEPEWELTPLKCLGFGAVVNFVGAPFALPYFAAVGQILKADLSMAQSFAVLGVYNAGYALPFMTVPALVAISGENSKPLLQRINTFLSDLTGRIMPWVILALGLFLLADALSYFATGTPLYQVNSGTGT